MNDSFFSKDQTLQMKAILCIMVVFYHTSDNTFIFSACGNWAVSCFFFISGYALECSIANSKLSWRKCIKKFNNFVIPYIIAAALWHLLFAFFPSGYPYNTVYGALKSYLLFKPVVHGGWYVEALFIMFVIYFISVLVSRGKEKIFVITGAVLYILFTVAILLYSGEHHVIFGSHFLLIGALFRRHLKEYKQFVEKKKVFNSIGIGSLVLTAVLMLLNFKNPRPIYSVYAIILYNTAPIVLLYLSTCVKLNFKILRFIGERSYWIYLIHIGVRYWIDQYKNHGFLTYFNYGTEQGSFILTLFGSIILATIIEFAYRNSIAKLRVKIDL